MWTINDHDFSLPICLQWLFYSCNALGIEIRPFAAAAKNEEAIVVASSFYDGC